MKHIHTHTNKQRRKLRVRARINANADQPRLCVHRTNQHIYAQIIDDQNHKTLAASSDIILKTKGTPTEIAQAVGQDIAEKAKKAGVKSIIFDRGKFAYHGRIKALAEGARQAGLQF